MCWHCHQSSERTISNINLHSSVLDHQLSCRASEGVQECNRETRWLFINLISGMETTAAPSEIITGAAAVGQNPVKALFLAVIFCAALERHIRASVRWHCRHVPSAWGGLSGRTISPGWSWCAGIPLPTTWSCPAPLSRCWRTGQSRAMSHRQEWPRCDHTTADKIIGGRERGRKEQERNTVRDRGVAMDPKDIKIQKSKYRHSDTYHHRRHGRNNKKWMHSWHVRQVCHHCRCMQKQWQWDLKRHTHAHTHTRKTLTPNEKSVTHKLLKRLKDCTGGERRHLLTFLSLRWPQRSMSEPTYLPGVEPTKYTLVTGNKMISSFQLRATVNHLYVHLQDCVTYYRTVFFQIFCIYTF